MHIGGLQKTSLIDYPGKISCVVFLSGCNFRCPYCHNPALVRRQNAALPPDVVMDFLAERRGFLEGVVISGGEPTLQQDLPGLLARIKSMGFSVKLDTNGSRPDVVGRLVREGLVDFLAMDIKTDPYRYAPHIHPAVDPETLISSIRQIMTAGLPYEFRTTCVRPLIDERILTDICRLIQGAERYVLQCCRDAAVLDPDFFAVSGRRLGEAEMAELRSLAASWVRECEVR